jgi:hypothetical protein
LIRKVAFAQGNFADHLATTLSLIVIRRYDCI